MPRPAELWPSLRAFVGGPAELLPAAPELAAAGLIGLGALSGGSFDFRSPCAVVVVGDAAAQPVIVLGFRVQSGAELVAQLTTGNTPTHRLETDGELTVLSPVRPGTGTQLAVLGDGLLVGPRAALSKAAVYIARGLLLRTPNAKSSSASLHLFGDALRDVVVPALRARWITARRELELGQEREKTARKRPADFAEPGALLMGADAALESVLAVLETAAGMEGELELHPALLTTRVRITPRGEGAARELGKGLPLGSASSLAALPDTAAVGLLLRRVLSEPNDAGAPATDSERAVRSLFGSRIGAAEERALRQISEAVDLGRGAEQVLALLAGKTIVWRGTVRDAENLRRGLSGAYKMVAREPLRPLFRELFGDPDVSSMPIRLPGFQEPVERTLFRFSPNATQRAAGKAKTQMELLSLIEPQRFLVVAGEPGQASLEPALRAERGEGSLARAPVAGPLLAELDQVALALFVDLAKLGFFGAPGEAPVLLSFGAAQGLPEASLTVSRSALRAVIEYGIRR